MSWWSKPTAACLLSGASGWRSGPTWISSIRLSALPASRARRGGSDRRARRTSRSRVPRQVSARTPGRPRGIVAPAGLGHRRAHEPRADREDEDVARRELRREDLREAVKRGLAPPVRGAREAARRQVRCGAGDVDDAAAAARQHQRDCRPAAEEDAADVDLEHLPPPRRRLLLIKGHQRALHTRVVDEQVDRARWSNQRATSSSCETSPASACPPICAATASIRALVRPVTQTSMPASARPQAMFAPTPLPPPVTSATRPSGDCGTDLLSKGSRPQSLQVIRQSSRKASRSGTTSASPAMSKFSCPA